MANKIDSNVTGLRYAEEDTIKNLPLSPVWYPLEPNGYNDFGGQLTTVARNPINPSRQRKKGVTTDLDASGGFGQDLTQNNLTRLLQGFFFADIREKVTNIPTNGTAVSFSGVTGTNKTYTLSSGTVGSQFLAGDLVLASGFDQAANNGLKNVDSSTATTVVVTQTAVDETPPATAKLIKVGFQFGSDEMDIVVSGSYPRLVRSSGTKDLTTLGLIVGEWVFIGGDATATKFTNAANNGFARVREVAATYIEFDKTAGTMVAETGTSKTIQLFYGNVLKNENAAHMIKRRTYQLERTLGQDGNGTMSEYLVGAVPNELSIQIRQADKVTVDLSFVATDNEQRDGSTGLKSGTRPDLVDAPAFNTSSDFSRIKMHLINAGNTNPDPLFAFLTELTLTINNNVTPNKAVAVLGAFDVSAGTFAVSGNVTAYFADIAAVQAVRNNSDVTLDFALVKNNAGMVWDIPLLALGDGRLNVEQDQPITLPLSVDAAESAAGYTLLLNEFPYLPNAADV
ncbi:MAG: phage tail tube protein [Methanomethylophilus sp.]